MATILVVDEDKNLRALLEQELTDEGYEIACVVNGAHALAYLRKNFVDLVILDVTCGMKSIEVLKRVRKLNKTIPVVLHTAYTFDYPNALTADALVAKSGDLTALVQTVAGFLRPQEVLDEVI